LAVGVFCLPKSVIGEWFVCHAHLDGASSYVGLFSYILGHANWQHLIGNFTFILLIGPILEERHGSLGLLVMILITALIGGLFNVVISHNLCLGASGVVFMMILLASMSNAKAGEIPLTLIIIALVFMSGELAAEFKKDDGIAHGAHLIGGLTGALFGFLQARPRSAAAAAAAAKPLKKPGS
jgi:membrane associated rhomboid family serine protease